MSAQEDFINQVKDGAQESQQKYGILASLTIAQAILESGWGQHVIANNLFGIKANGYTGPCVTVNTKEFVNGQYVNTTSSFRSYPTLAASVEDHGSFLASNPRYSNILHFVDYQKVCELIQQDGYATDPTYANQLIGLIKQYSLTQYDAPVPTPVPAAAPTLAHGIGENVVFSTCYSSSTDGPDKVIPADRMLRNHGVITKTYPGSHNPYLLDDGLCFVNDGDIRGPYATPAPAPAPVPAKHTETVKNGTYYIRSAAGTVSGIVGTAKGGQAFITTVLASGWRQVSYNGKTAYIGPAAFN